VEESGRQLAFRLYPQNLLGETEENNTEAYYITCYKLLTLLMYRFSVPAIFTNAHKIISSDWCINKSRDSSVGIALRYGLDDRGSRVRFPARTGNFSPHYRVQNISRDHPASYPLGTRGSFPGGKAAGA
jgi:hypothetical protein